MQPEIDLGSDNHLVITKSIVLERTLSRKANCKYVHRREFELCPWLAERNNNRNLMEKTPQQPDCPDCPNITIHVPESCYPPLLTIAGRDQVTEPQP